MRDRDLGLVCRALADPTRRRVLDLLREHARGTGELCAAFPALSRFAVLKHLGILRRARLVLVRAEGRERTNFLNAVPLRAIGERWLTAAEAADASGLLALARLAERGERSGARPAVPPRPPESPRRAPARGARSPRRLQSPSRPVEKPS
jgi:DNA-binding transcriptional ArsR family regulator